MYKLNFITDILEEQIAKGNLRWLASFSEIHKDYTIGEATFPIYASGELREKGFFLSKIYSAFVTPRYKVHLFFYTTPEINPKLLRKLILSCKSKFGADDWIFLGLAQNQPFERTARAAITNTADRTVGITAFSLTSKETVTSDNVLGRGLAKHLKRTFSLASKETPTSNNIYEKELAKQLKLTEAKFESFDVPNYIKSFTMIFSLGTVMLIFMALSGIRQVTANMSLVLLLMVVFSLIAGHRLYKARYHVSLWLNSNGFRVQEGGKVQERKWSDYTDMTIHITPRLETCLRLHSKDENFDLPLSRVGIPRKEAYSAIKQLIKRKQNVTQ